MELYPVKGTCTVFVGSSSYDNPIIGYTGGTYGEENIWELEIGNSNHIDEIFGRGYPEKQGFYVWEGEMEPVEEDAPILNGKWRDATKEDMAALIKK